MKNLITSVIALLLACQINAQGNLEDPEKTQSAQGSVAMKATLTSASRLFKDKEDLTSVIVIIPAETVC